MRPAIIDFSRLSDADEQGRLAAACREYGFFALANHGLETARSTFFSETSHFFHQPEAAKLALERSQENPFGFYNRELTKNQPDWKEVFDISLSDQTPTQWPDEPAFIDSMRHWSEVCHGIALRLLRAVFEALDLDYDQHFFEPEHASFLRLNYYPPCPTPAPANTSHMSSTPETFAVSHHTDAGALTLLQQDGTEGLQFLVDGQWQTAPADPAYLFVNLGDMLQVWTNDECCAPLHRVLANSNAERFSAPYFLNPGYHCDCRPLTGDKPRYTTVNFGEFRRGRADGDYADVGEEIQISQFRI